MLRAQHKKIFGLILPIVFLCGCANPTFTETKNSFVPQDWRTVAILPFSGDKRFTAVAAETFSAHLLNIGKLKLVQPSETELTVRKLGVVATESGFTVFEAQRIATDVNADAVIIGVVTSHNTGATLNGFCTAKLVDVKTGEIVAVSHHPSGLLFGYSEHQAVVTATERTSKEIARILVELELKTRFTPTKIGNARQTTL